MDKCEGYRGSFACIGNRTSPLMPISSVLRMQPLRTVKCSCTHHLPVQPDFVIKQDMQFVTFAINYFPATEYVLVTSNLGAPRRLLYVDHQSDRYKILDAFKDLCDISNISCNPFLRCTSSAFVQLKVFTPQKAYHEELLEGYIDVLRTFTSNIYRLVVHDNHPLRVAQMLSRKDKEC